MFLITCEYILNFNDDSSKLIHIETDLYQITNLKNLKKYLLYETDNFLEKEDMFSRIDELNITQIIDKMCMTYDYFKKHPMPAVETKLSMIISKTPNLIKALNRSHIHPIFRKHSHIR